MNIRGFLTRLALRAIPGMRELKAEVHRLRQELERNQDIWSRDLLILSRHVDRVAPEEFDAWDLEDTRRQFRALLGYPLDLDNPRSFNEKMTWLKFYYRDPRMPVLADKYRVREELKTLGLGDYLNELYGTYRNGDELLEAWDGLPESFVVKANHYSGENVFVKDKASFDVSRFARLDRVLHSNYYFHRHRRKTRFGFNSLARTREWPYRDIPPRLVVERYLAGESGDLRDYKVFCFAGRPQYIQVHFNRFHNHTQTIYDTLWQAQAFTTTVPAEPKRIPKPAKLDEILQVASVLAEGFPFVRVDFYITADQRVVFGEVTFFHHGGMARFTPPEWDYKLGEFITLSKAMPGEPNRNESR